jgi:hypothetical protein
MKRPTKMPRQQRKGGAGMPTQQATGTHDAPLSTQVGPRTTRAATRRETQATTEAKKSDPPLHVDHSYAAAEKAHITDLSSLSIARAHGKKLPGQPTTHPTNKQRRNSLHCWCAMLGRRACVSVRRESVAHHSDGRSMGRSIGRGLAGRRVRRLSESEAEAPHQPPERPTRHDPSAPVERWLQSKP